MLPSEMSRAFLRVCFSSVSYTDALLDIDFICISI